MYATGPPAPGGPPGPGQLRISAMARRAFDGPPVIAGRPGHRAHLREYLSDLVRPYQLSLREDDAGGHSYGEMAATLVGELVSPERPVGVVVLAFAIPDVRPGRATATYLSELCPGHPLAFAICDQGGAAAFTGLRLVGEYTRTGDRQRALLLVVEQAALPYDAGLPVDLPRTHTAVGLRCDRTGPARVSAVHQHAGVPPDRAAGLLADELAASVTGHGEVSLIADAPLAGAVTGAALAGRVRVIPAGHPHTGGWWELAGLLAAGPPPGSGRVAGRRVVLATYDRQLRYLCVSTIDILPGE